MESMKLFVERMDMYIQPISRETIISFISGYEWALKHRKLTDEISKHLEEKYSIQKPAIGYPYQIKVYSTRNNISWVEGFDQIMSEILNNEPA